MKKALFSVIVCFTACSEDDDDARTVSFKRAVYILSSNQAIEVEIGLSEVAEQELTVPFEVFGTAVEGEEYSLSAHEFVVAPVVESLAEKYAGKIDFYKVDIDQESELASSG